MEGWLVEETYALSEGIDEEPHQPWGQYQVGVESIEKRQNFWSLQSFQFD